MMTYLFVRNNSKSYEGILKKILCVWYKGEMVLISLHDNRDSFADFLSSNFQYSF